MANFIFHLGSFIRRIYLSSRRVLFQTIYVILVIITLLLCGYNVFQSFVEYALHPQVVTLEKQPPFQTDFPGLTICAPSIFTPKRLGEIFYSFKKTHDDFLKKYPNPNEDYPKEESLKQVEMFRSFESKAFQKFTLKQLIFKESVQLDELVTFCKYHPINIRYNSVQDESMNFKPINCTSIKPALQTIFLGRKCFSFFGTFIQQDNLIISQKDNHDRASPIEEKYKKIHVENEEYKFENNNLPLNGMMFDMNPSIEIQVKTHKMWYYLNIMPIRISLHTPNIFPFTGRNRFVEIKYNNLYQISYTKSFSNLEESPFGCEDYNKIGLYKSQFECLNKCIQGWFVRHNKCLNYYTYIIDMDVCNNCTICQHKRESFDQYLAYKSLCLEICLQDCQTDEFKMLGDVNPYNNCVMNQNTILRSLPNTTTTRFVPDQICESRVLIKLSTFPFNILTSKYDNPFHEMFGVIGGYCGFALGLSMYSLVNFFIYLICRNFKFCCTFFCGKN